MSYILRNYPSAGYMMILGHLRSRQLFVESMSTEICTVIDHRQKGDQHILSAKNIALLILL